MSEKVLVAMSGGVDSSVALLKIVEAGYEAIGITMKLWEYKDVSGNLLEFRSSWRINYLSWKNRKYPKIIIRYEDLHLNPYDNFKKILIFINSFQKIEIEDSKIKKSINECSFDKLSKLEKSIGFDEQLKGRTFFRKGLIDEWKSKLNSEQTQKIENAFAKEMKELQYI